MKKIAPSESRNSLSFLRTEINCSWVPFSRWTRFTDFFRCSGHLAYMVCFLMVRAAILIALLVSLRRSSGKSTIFWFVDWIRIAKMCVLLWLLTEDWRFSYIKLLEFLPKYLVLSANVFECLQRILPYERVKRLDFVILSQLVINIQACMKDIFKHFKLLRFPVKCGHSCDEWHWQLKTLIDVVFEINRVAVARQLLKAGKIWFGSNFAWMFSRRSCDWLVEHAFFWFPEEIAGD